MQLVNLCLNRTCVRWRTRIRLLLEFSTALALSLRCIFKPKATLNVRKERSVRACAVSHACQLPQPPMMPRLTRPKAHSAPQERWCD
jgi:hypothetical protein